jgi:hypothetical protein
MPRKTTTAPSSFAFKAAVQAVRDDAAAFRDSDSDSDEEAPTQLLNHLAVLSSRLSTSRGSAMGGHGDVMERITEGEAGTVMCCNGVPDVVCGGPERASFPPVLYG